VQRRRKVRALLPIAACIARLASVHAGDGPLGLDHPVAFEDKGIWARKNQTLLLDAMLVGEASIGLWEGGETRLGHTAWQFDRCDAHKRRRGAASQVDILSRAAEPDPRSKHGLRGTATRASRAAK
jgi:hypothetical protein